MRAILSPSTRSSREALGLEPEELLPRLMRAVVGLWTSTAS
jgi:hypothetical protein